MPSTAKEVERPDNIFQYAGHFQGSAIRKDCLAAGILCRSLKNADVESREFPFELQRYESRHALVFEASASIVINLWRFAGC